MDNKNKIDFNNLFVDVRNDLYNYYGYLNTINNLLEYELVIVDRPNSAIAGKCRTTKKQIMLNISCVIYKTSDNKIKEYRNTLLHELIHALFPTDGHCKRWKKLSNNINSKKYFIEKYGVIQRCYPISKSELIDNNVYKYKITCQKCGSTFYRKKASDFVKNTSHYRCLTCYGDNWQVEQLR